MRFNKPNEASLWYKYEASEGPKRKQGGVGEFYKLPSKNVPDSQFHNAINNISSIQYSKIDSLLNRVVSIGKKQDKETDIKQHLTDVYNIENIKKTNIQYYIDKESKSPLLAAGGDLITIRRSFEYYDAFCKDLTPNSVDAEPYLHKVKMLDEVLPIYENLVNKMENNRKTFLNKFNLDLQLFATPNVIPGTVGPGPYKPAITKDSELLPGLTDTTSSELDKEKIKRALLWLYRKEMPIDIFRRINLSGVNRYIGLLKSTMVERMDMITHYILKGPTMLSNIMHKAKVEALRPLYFWISKLPAMPREVDDVLFRYIQEAETVFNEGEKKVRELLQLNRLEQILYERRAEAIRELEEHFAFTAVLDDILNQINTFDVENLVGYVAGDNNENEVKDGVSETDK